MYKVNGMDPQKIRKDFPILYRKVHGKQLVYFDNAATSQKPLRVLQVIDEFYKTSNANIHRGVHQLSSEATHAYEESRKKVKKFISAKSGAEIVFTRGTTEAINLVAASLDIKKDDKILCTVMEHHSNMVPWMLAKQRTGASLEFVDITDDGFLDMNDLEKKIGKTKLFAVTHASNVLGTINDIKEISKLCKENDALLLVDGAQSTPHHEIDVQNLGCDFFAFSGHKMCGPTGIGCLYARKEHLEKMRPYQGGGEMIREVHLDGAKWNDLPWKFEGGTPNISGAIGLGAAVDYILSIGIKDIRDHEVALTKYAFERLSEIRQVRIFGPREAKDKTGVISFNVGDIHSHDIATILDGEGVAVRSGHHCAQPLIERYNVPSMTRASFYFYNTEEEIDTLISAIGKCIKIFNIK